jgi:hypothetical protein
MCGVFVYTDVGNRPEEIFDYQSSAFPYVYGDGECK